MPFQGAFPQGINPWYVGQRYPAWSPQLGYDDSTPQKFHPVDLTPVAASNITLLIQIVDASGTPVGGNINGAGVIAIVDAVNGKISYVPDAADSFVTTTGYVQLQWKVTFPGTLPWFSDLFILQTKLVA